MRYKIAAQKMHAIVRNKGLMINGGTIKLSLFVYDEITFLDALIDISCLLRNLYAGQEATVRTGHGTNWFQIGKGVRQGYILSPCVFNLYAEYIMRNAGLGEAHTSWNQDCWEKYQ